MLRKILNLLKNKLIFVLCLTSIFCLSGCDTNKEFDSETLCSQYLASVVEIKVCNDEDSIIGYATGTVVDSNGGILTNKHVIRIYDSIISGYKTYENIYVRFYNQDEHIQAEIAKISEEADLALLRINSKIEKYFSCIENMELNYGQQIHTIGNGNGYGLAYYNGYIAAPLREIKYENETIQAIQLSMYINEGNSGGPLFDNQGNLAGLISFRLYDTSGNPTYGTCFALTSKTIIDFMK